MKLSVYLIGEGGSEMQVYQNNDFYPHDVANDKSIIDEAYDVAFREVVFNYFHDGFGYNRHDIQSTERDALQSILSCSGRNVRYKFSEDGTMQIAEDNSLPNRVFKIEITK